MTPARKGERCGVHWLLSRLILFNYSYDDWGWPSVSILYRVSTEGHVVRSGKAGHKILAPDMPSDLRRVQLAFNDLRREEKQVITVKYMPYLKDGKSAMDKDRARFMGLSPNKFKDTYHNAAKKVIKTLKTTVHNTSNMQ